jgi:hypothetical protein
VLIKKSCELERKGLTLNPFLFRKEAILMRKCKNSVISNYQHLYHELLVKSSRRLDRPAQTADVYVLARLYRYLLLKTEKLPADSPEGRIQDSFKKDYF